MWFIFIILELKLLSHDFIKISYAIDINLLIINLNCISSLIELAN